MLTNPLLIQHAIITEIANQMLAIADNRNYLQIKIPSERINHKLEECGLTLEEIERFTALLALEEYIKIDYSDNQKEAMSITMKRKGVSAANSEYFIREFLKQNKEEEKSVLETSLIQSNLTTNRYTRRNVWTSSIFAGVAALMAILSFILAVQERLPKQKIEQLQQQVTRRDSLLQIQQTQIDSLLIITARRDSVPK